MLALLAAARGGRILPLFIAEPEAWAQPDASARQWAFCVAECLREFAWRSRALRRAADRPNRPRARRAGRSLRRNRHPRDRQLRWKPATAGATPATAPSPMGAGQRHPAGPNCHNPASPRRMASRDGWGPCPREARDPRPPPLRQAQGLLAGFPLDLRPDPRGAAETSGLPFDPLAPAASAVRGRAQATGNKSPLAPYPSGPASN